MRSLVLAIALLFGLVPLATADSGSAVGSGSALTAPPDPSSLGSGSAVAPVDKLHDPLTNPVQALDDVKAAHATKIGWPLALLACLVMLARVLQALARKYPTNKTLIWIAGDSHAFIVAGVLTVGSAAYNTLALGGTWYAVAAAAGGSFLALMVPAGKGQA